MARWLGSDLARHERLKEEFHRIWVDTWGASSVAARPPVRSGATEVDTHSASVAVLHQTGTSPPQTQVVVHREPTPLPRPTNGSGATAGPPATSKNVANLVVDRRESYLCTVCKKMGVYSEWDGDEMKVVCRSCGTHFDDLLALIPVVRVSPMEFYFGGGSEGLATAAGLALVAILVYAGLNYL